MIGDMAPLHRAAIQDNMTTVLLLVDAGADINGQDPYGRTAAHMAAMDGCLYALKELVSRGASLLIKDSMGRTPIDCTVQYGRDTAREILTAARPKTKVQT